MAWWSLIGGTAVTAAERLVNGVGKGLGSVMNRIGWTEKLSEKERWSMLIEMSGMDLKDSDTARQMAMVEMQTQKLPWAIRFLNGAFRPLCGYVAMGYLTESIWSQALSRFGWSWVPTTHDPTVDLCMLSIIGFFFGLRQRTKEKAVTSIN